jgi:uncharacterized protein YjbI with pentapeptide repeats
MAGDKGTHTAEQENDPDKRPPWWKRLWARTGFGDKTLWDLLQLLIVPLALAGIGFWFSTQQDARQQAVEEQRAQDEALQAYLDQMSSLMIGKNSLRNSEEDSEVRTLARARTLTVLGRLDPKHKKAVVQFLVDAKLVQSVDERPPIVGLSGANLSGANLSGAPLSGAELIEADLGDADLRWADLSDAILSGAILSGANLSGANLSGANLSRADLRDADLSGVIGINNAQLEYLAFSLEGATMPNGQKYEDWLRSKGRAEDGENSIVGA